MSLRDFPGAYADQLNHRLVVPAYPRSVPPAALTARLVSIAERRRLDKIWLWSFLADVSAFENEGFQVEAVTAEAPQQKPTVSLAYFLNASRAVSRHTALEDQILTAVCRQGPAAGPKPLPAEVAIRLLSAGDAGAISRLLEKTFSTYPAPVSDPGYIQKLMEAGCLFAGALSKHRLVSVVGAYPEACWQRCEITDCATLPAYRGMSLINRLAGLLEPAVREKGPYTLYSLARAGSRGMNRVLFNLGYRFQGRLINNCHIGGRFEDMNLWVRY